MCDRNVTRCKKSVSRPLITGIYTYIFIDTRAYIIYEPIYILALVRVHVPYIYIILCLVCVYDGERNKSPFKRDDDDDDFELH